MSQGERGPHSSGHEKDKAGHDRRGEWGGRRMFSQATQVTGSPALLAVDGALQTLLPESLGETGAKASLHLPAMAFLASLTVLQTPAPTTLGVSCIFDTPTAILGGLQGSPSTFLTLASPSPVLLTPHHLCQTLTLPWYPCSQGAEFALRL